jgi:NAD(P)-dependent dehydrogenase (short-subunit alcohol dehydrogenase family)
MSKVAVVTGASKGIGAATALAFSRAGYEVAINYLSDDKAASELVTSIESAGGKASKFKADVSSERGVNQLFKAVEVEFGKIDVLVNNAGFPKEPPLWGMDTGSNHTKLYRQCSVCCALYPGRCAVDERWWQYPI